MIILRPDEIDQKKAHERFERVDGKYHRIRLPFGPWLSNKPISKMYQLYEEDWRFIFDKIREDYRNSNHEFIVISSAYFRDSSDRLCDCWTDVYIRKLHS